MSDQIERSRTITPGSGWIFILTTQLPEVGSRYVIRKVSVVPHNFILKPRNSNGSLRPAIHALNDEPRLSQFQSTSYKSFGSVTDGAGDIGLLIDTTKVKRAGGRIIQPAELIVDLRRFAAQYPTQKFRVQTLINGIQKFEGEGLIEGTIPRGSARRLSPEHTRYLRRGEQIFEPADQARGRGWSRERIAAVQDVAAKRLQALDKTYRTARNVGRVGRAVTAFGLVVTAYDVTNAAGESIEQRSFRPITAEGVRQVGGWGAAVAGVKFGFVAGAALGIETGPGAILTGAIGSMIFGIGGYIGADRIADLIYEN